MPGCGDHLLLVGMMGAGKSTIGRITAARLGRPFRDSDADVERRTGKSVPEIFAERGEAAFRAEERVALCAAMASVVPSVIAVAGGAVLDPEARRRMRYAGMVVFLDVSPDVLARRVGSGSGRPLLDSNPERALALLDAVRRPVYLDLADLVVRPGARLPTSVAEQVARSARLCLERCCPR